MTSFHSTHVVIIGTGVAGLSAALSAAALGSNVTLVAAGRDIATQGGNTQLAQGGIAAAIGAADNPAQHAADTIAAGAGLVDPQAAKLLTNAGAQAVTRLIADGFPVDRDTAGAPVLGMEGAHGIARIVHAGEDRTGAELHAHLCAQLRRPISEGRIVVSAGRIAHRLVVRDGAVRGAVLHTSTGTTETVTADAVILATGGYAGLFPRSTTAPGVRGEGILLASRAGALLADLEFVQFHPTVIHGTGALISEAVRGAGAVLLDGSGKRFMLGIHRQADLAPRDVVSRAIHRTLLERGEDSVWLDATGVAQLAERFPTITAVATELGYDWSSTPIPVSPAAHYSMGGVATDQWARTSVPGLFAVGEVAATGVHGANRLASNSLLEGLVYGERAGQAATKFAGEFAWDTSASVADLEQAMLRVDVGGAEGSAGTGSTPSPTGVTTAQRAVSSALATGLGIERDAAGLDAARRVFNEHQNLAEAQLGTLIAAAAQARTESRGAHQRGDFPSLDPAQVRRRSLLAVFPTESDPTGTHPTPQALAHQFAQVTTIPSA